MCKRTYRCFATWQVGRAPAGATCRNLLSGASGEAIHREVMCLRTHCRAIKGLQGRRFTERSHTGGPLLASWGITESHSLHAGRQVALCCKVTWEGGKGSCGSGKAILASQESGAAEGTGGAWSWGSHAVGV